MEGGGKLWGKSVIPGFHGPSVIMTESSVHMRMGKPISLLFEKEEKNAMKKLTKLQNIYFFIFQFTGNDCLLIYRVCLWYETYVDMYPGNSSIIPNFANLRIVAREATCSCMIWCLGVFWDPSYSPHNRVLS